MSSSSCLRFLRFRESLLMMVVLLVLENIVFAQKLPSIFQTDSLQKQSLLEAPEIGIFEEQFMQISQNEKQTGENISNYDDHTNRVRSSQEDGASNRSLSSTVRQLVFQEQYHYPVTSSACKSYQLSDMFDSTSQQFISTSVFQERYLVYAAIMSALGSTNINISFKCVDALTYETTYGTEISGQFGSDSRAIYGSQHSYKSIPTTQVHSIYVYASVSPPSLNVLFSLGWFFFLGIFLAPIVAGGILLLLSRISTTKIYGYQGLVFGMFRYLNRQGDQQMFQWNHKILAFFLALFFFFHYALLLSSLTSSRITQIPSDNKDRYTDARNYQGNITQMNAASHSIIVDTYQYAFLTDHYTIHQQLSSTQQSLSIQQYNLQLSTTEFSAAEIDSIQLAISELRESLEISRVNYSTTDLYNIHNNNVFFNGLVLIAGLILATLFKLIQVRFRSLNSLTEISSYREYCNRQIANSLSGSFADFLAVTLSHVQAKDYSNKFKKLQILNFYRFPARQVFRIIQKRNKKSLKHKKKKILNNNNTNGTLSLLNQSKYLLQDKPLLKAPTVYSVIKTFLQSERKGEITQQSNPKSREKRKGIYQRAASSAFQDQDDNNNRENMILPQLPRPFVPKQNSLGAQESNNFPSSPAKASIFRKRETSSQLKQPNTSIEIPFFKAKQMGATLGQSCFLLKQKTEEICLRKNKQNDDLHIDMDVVNQQNNNQSDKKDTSITVIDTLRKLNSSQTLSPSNDLLTHPDIPHNQKNMDENIMKTSQIMTEGDEDNHLLSGQNSQRQQISKEQSEEKNKNMEQYSPTMTRSIFNPVKRVQQQSKEQESISEETKQDKKDANAMAVRIIPVNIKNLIARQRDDFMHQPFISENQQNNHNNIVLTKNNKSNMIQAKKKNSLSKDEESMSICEETDGKCPALNKHHVIPVSRGQQFMQNKVIKVKDFNDAPDTVQTTDFFGNRCFPHQIEEKAPSNAELHQYNTSTPAREKQQSYTAQYSSETPDSKQLTNLTDEDSHRKNSDNTRPS